MSSSNNSLGSFDFDDEDEFENTATTTTQQDKQPKAKGRSQQEEKPFLVRKREEGKSEADSKYQPIIMPTGHSKKKVATQDDEEEQRGRLVFNNGEDDENQNEDEDLDVIQAEEDIEEENMFFQNRSFDDEEAENYERASSFVMRHARAISVVVFLFFIFVTFIALQTSKEKANGDGSSDDNDGSTGHVKNPAIAPPSFLPTHPPVVPPTTSTPTTEPPTETIPPTNYPTRKVEKTMYPTLALTETDLENDAPVNSLSDARYGPPIQTFSTSRKQAWAENYQKRYDLTKNLRSYNDTVKQTLHDELCNKINAQLKETHPIKYVFPRENDSSSEFVTSYDKLRRMRQFRAAMFEYRYGESGVDPYIRPKFDEAFLRLYDPKSKQAGVNELVLNRLGHSMKRILQTKKKIVIGTMGTSVISGQDNCYSLSYAPLIKRELDRLLKPLGIEVEVRGMGQNGDGPDTYVQSMCACETLNVEDVDILVLYYPMIQMPPPFGSEYFYRSCLHKNKDLLFFSLIAAFPWPGEIFSAGYIWNFDFFPGSIPNPDSLRTEGWGEWSPNHYWGRYGDRWCHMETREHEAPTMMQNWHNGPLLIQQHVDFFLDTWAEGFIRALKSIISEETGKKKEEEDALLPLPEPIDSSFSSVEAHKNHLACYTSYGPQYSKHADLVNGDFWIKDYSNTPFGTQPTTTSLPEATSYRGEGGRFAVTLIKERSNIGMAQEQYYAHVNYNNRPECSAHIDRSFAPILFEDGTERKPGILVYRSKNWFVFQLTKDGYARMVGSEKMDIYSCDGDHSGNYPDYRPTFHMQFAINGKDFGPSVDLTKGVLKLDATCFTLVRGVKVPISEEERKETYYGITFVEHFNESNLPARLPAFSYRFHSIIFLGAKPEK